MPDILERLKEELALDSQCELDDPLRKDCAAEIERLRGLLAEIGKQHSKLAGLVRGAQVPLGANDALDAIERCVREALGE